MEPVGLDHVVVEVRDVEKSVAFYGEGLGMQSVRLGQFREGKAPFVSMRAGASLVDLMPSDLPGPGPHHFCLTYAVSMAELVAQLDAAGIAHQAPGRRFGALGTGESVYVHDPDGHMVELRTYNASSGVTG